MAGGSWLDSGGAVSPPSLTRANHCRRQEMGGGEKPRSQMNALPVYLCHNMNNHPLLYAYLRN